jgi:amino acid transporter
VETNESPAERVPRVGGGHETGPGALRRELTFRDVVLFFVTTGTNLQWVAFAAGAGPSSLVVWGLGAFAMFIPLAVCIISLSSRRPEEGGIYIWSREAFGPFAGFMTGWTYWCSNLPYFPGLLYFTAGSALFVFGGEEQVRSAGPAYFVLASLAGLALATALNVVGLGVGKWLNNAGAVSRWLSTFLLVGIGAAFARAHGSATAFTLGSLVPSFGLKGALFWSTIAFAWTGPEAASFMGDEIQNPRRTVPRALLASAPLIAAIYILGTASLLAAVPAQDVNPLYGVLQAIGRAEQGLGLHGITTIAAILVTLTCLGSVGAWLEAVARIPFVAGLDHYLPEAFGRLHPRWGSPHVALLTQAGVTVAFVVLGQAGTTVKGAYEVLVSMTLLVTFIPFLLVFASAIRLQGKPGGAEGIRLPRWIVTSLALVGFATTLGGIALSVLPSPGEPNPVLAVSKVVGGTVFLVGTGALVYRLGQRRRAR